MSKHSHISAILRPRFFRPIKQSSSTICQCIEQVVEPESSPQSGVTMLNNIVDNIEQCGQHNIVQSCFQQPVATHNFLPCTKPYDGRWTFIDILSQYFLKWMD